MSQRTFIIVLCLLAPTAWWAGWRLGVSSTAGAGTPGSVLARPASVKMPGAVSVSADYAEAGKVERSWRGGRPLAELQAKLAEGGDAQVLAALGELTADEARETLEFLLKLPPPQPEGALAAAVARWAALDGPSALGWMTAHLTPGQRERVRGAFLSGWAAQDAGEALAWYRAEWSQTPATTRYKLEQDWNALIYSMALRNPAAAVQACLTEADHGTFHPWWGLGSLVAQDDKREEVLRLISALPEGKPGKAALSSALGAWAGVDPAAAAAWLTANRPAPDQELDWSIAERFSRADPHAAADWVLARAGEKDRDKAVSMAISYWSFRDPAAASAWAEGAGVAAEAASMLAGAWAPKDPAKALSWVLRVEESRRPQIIGGVLNSIAKKDPKFDPATWSAPTGLPVEKLQALMKSAEREWGLMR